MPKCRGEDSSVLPSQRQARADAKLFCRKMIERVGQSYDCFSQSGCRVLQFVSPSHSFDDLGTPLGSQPLIIG